MEKPILLDIKMGDHYRPPDANPADIERKAMKLRGTTGESLAVRLTGISGVNAKGVPIPKAEDWESIGNEEVFIEKLCIFLTATLDVKKGQAIAAEIAQKLSKMERWFEKQRVASIFSSSIIFSADGARPARDPLVKVKIVDLPHFYPLKHIGAEGYLRGVRNLKRLWEAASNKLPGIPRCNCGLETHDYPDIFEFFCPVMNKQLKLDRKEPTVCPPAGPSKDQPDKENKQLTTGVRWTAPSPSPSPKKGKKKKKGAKP